jgi:hydrogenase nickel incorporation protein HypA/HybF
LHELSLAQSIVGTLLEVAESNAAKRVLGVRMEVGELALVNVDQLEWHIQFLVNGTVAEGVRVEWIHVAAGIRCLDCGYEGEVRRKGGDEALVLSGLSFDCPRCGNARTSIVAGRELRVLDMNVELEETGEEIGDDA